MGYAPEKRNIGSLSTFGPKLAPKTDNQDQVVGPKSVANNVRNALKKFEWFKNIYVVYEIYI